MSYSLDKVNINYFNQFFLIFFVFESRKKGSEYKISKFSKRKCLFDVECRDFFFGLSDDLVFCLKM